MAALKRITEENLTAETYKDLKAQGISDKQIYEHLGWYAMKMNQWKYRNGLLPPVPEPVLPRPMPMTQAEPEEEEETSEGAEADPQIREEEEPLLKHEILKAISKQIDRQTEKGIGKYSHSLDDCPADKYDWQLMINEELIDALQYQQKEIRRLSQSAEELTLLEYQNLSKRTMPEAAASAEAHKLNVSNYAMGLAGEAGEVVDLLKKHLHHGHELDKQALIGEIGDVLHYAAGLCSLLDVDFEGVAAHNIKKLEQRYPDGFSEQASINRAE